MSNEISKLLTRKEAAEVLGVRPETLAVWHCTRRYKLPLVKVGRSCRYRLADLEQWLATRTVGGSLMSLQEYKSEPCPICGHKGWCGHSEDGLVFVQGRPSPPEVVGYAYKGLAKDSVTAMYVETGKERRPTSGPPPVRRNHNDRPSVGPPRWKRCTSPPSPHLRLSAAPPWRSNLAFPKVPWCGTGHRLERHRPTSWRPLNRRRLRLSRI